MTKQRRKIVNNANLPALETWQMKRFARNAKKGYRFFQPDGIAKPTPRSYYEAFGQPYKKDDDRRQETITTWVMVAFVVLYILGITLT